MAGVAARRKTAIPRIRSGLLTGADPASRVRILSNIGYLKPRPMDDRNGTAGAAPFRPLRCQLNVIVFPGDEMFLMASPDVEPSHQLLLGPVVMSKRSA